MRNKKKADHRKKIGADGYISTGFGGVLAHDPRPDKIHRLKKP